MEYYEKNKENDFLSSKILPWRFCEGESLLFHESRLGRCRNSEKFFDAFLLFLPPAFFLYTIHCVERKIFLL
jgi:hypothetical protein